MKKLTTLFAVVIIIAFAAPVFATPDTLAEVPTNNWAYGALEQLASNGIISVYPNGLGTNPITRGEAASIILSAITDGEVMKKASDQDVDMLKRLAVEFNDELIYIGVKVNSLDDISYIQP